VDTSHHRRKNRTVPHPAEPRKAAHTGGRRYAGEIVFMVMALAAILLIGLIGGISLFALPLKGWEPPALITADMLIVTALQSWRRTICAMRAKGDHAWRVILIGPAVTLLFGAVAAGLANR
jgi:hypothetical protein